MHLKLTISVLLSCFLFTEGAKYKPVTVLKCCSKKEYLSKDTKYNCTPGGPDNYLPKIYSPKLKVYLPKNEVPQHWNITSKIPQCPENHKLVPFSQLPPVVMENGSLFLPTLSGAMMDPSLYCFDYKVALVCLETPANMSEKIVKKCCGKTGIFTEEKKGCVRANSTEFKFNLNGSFHLMEGFPSCSGGLVITGNFTENNLMKNGSLLLPDNNLMLKPKSFCLDYVLEKKGK